MHFDIQIKVSLRIPNLEIFGFQEGNGRNIKLEETQWIKIGPTGFAIFIFLLLEPERILGIAFE